MQYNFRIDEQTKIQFEKLCNELGLSSATAFTMFAKQAVREQMLPLDLKLQKELDYELFGEKTKKAINESQIEKEFDNVQELSDFYENNNL